MGPGVSDCIRAAARRLHEATAKDGRCRLYPRGNLRRVITLDTNQVDTLGGPRGALYVMLAKVANASGHELALPQMVLTEHLAHYEHDVAVELAKIKGACDRLERLGAKPDITLGLPTVEASVSKRRADLEHLFTILPTPDGAAEEGLRREALRIAPADTDWEKKGASARDVVIWLTVLEAAAKPDAEVLFVSADRDFSDKHCELYESLKEELTARTTDPRALTVRESVVSLLEELAERVELPADFDHDSISRLDVKFLVESTVRSHGYRSAAHLFRPGSDVEVVAFVRRINGRPRGMARAYWLGQEEWICLEGRWEGDVEVNIVVADSPSIYVEETVPFTFDGTCLASRTPEGQLARLATLMSSTGVRFGEPVPRSPGDAGFLAGLAGSRFVPPSVDTAAR